MTALKACDITCDACGRRRPHGLHVGISRTAGLCRACAAEFAAFRRDREATRTAAGCDLDAFLTKALSRLTQDRPPR